MTSTTIADQERRRLRIIAWSIAVVFHVVVAVTVWMVPSLRHSVLGMSEDEIQEVAKIEREAAERRKQREEQRKKQLIPTEFREDLKQEIAQRRRDDLRASVEKLRDIREKIEKEQVEAFDELRKFQVERSPEDLEELLERVYQNIRRARVDEPLDTRRKEIQRQISAARKQIESLQENVRSQPQREKTADASLEIAQATQVFAEDLDRDSEQKREALAKINEQLEKLDKESDEAKQLAEQAERLQRNAQINRQLARNLSAHAQKLKEASAHVRQSPEVTAATAIPPEALNPPEAGTPADDQTLAEQSADELYETARKLEQEIDRRYRDTRAAQQAIRDRSSFEEARQVMASVPRTERPDLAKQIADTSLQTLGDATQLREMFRQALNQTQLMQADAQRKLVEVDPSAAEQLGRNLAKAPTPTATPSGNAPAASGGTSTPYGNLGGDGQDATDSREPTLSEEQAAATALPGRRFTDAAARKGWMYIDTWYVIGPWDLSQYAGKPLPPEYEINLDAVYTNGKSGNFHHPRLRQRFDLDGRLTWQFIQSESIYIRPPNETEKTIYYAYTEVFSDREREVLMAIDIDDRSFVWVNDQEVWRGTVKAWRFGQVTRKVTLKPGYNKILIRMDNDAALMDFSLVMLASD